jgi:damage-control phosphatase, subfamily I
VGPVKIWPDCIPCILKMSLGVARVAMKDEEQVRRFMEGVLKLKYFNGKNQEVTSPDVIRDVWSKLIEVTGEADPLRKLKEEQNRKALATYPKAKALVLKSRDPFLGAVKLAIAANSIDAMTDVKGEAPKEIIKKWNRLKIDWKQMTGFKERVKKAKKVVYLGDNCGEIVFDKLFIEVLLAIHPVDITYVTRTLPIMNDATLPDALFMGMGKVAQITENGVSEHFPGTFLKKINSELKKLIDGSDLVISKGGGNYDSLTEEEKLKGKTSFLFLAKCFPYCQLHRVSLNAPVIYNF